MLDRALANEYNAMQDASHLMRYELLKTSPRLTSTKKICETRDGDVARLIALNGKPLSPADEQKEEARLNALMSDPGKQERRKQAESEDTGRVLKVLRALPAAFMYRTRAQARARRERWRSSPSNRIPGFHRRIWRRRF